MIRNILKYLDKWKTKELRRPLLLRGARQVGKTWVVREHSKTYASFVEINLEERPEATSSFKELFGRPNDLIRSLEHLTAKSIVPGETLLFIDEIQECADALKALRYFKEKLPSLHIIAAGSLLEFTIKENPFPVGRVEFAYLFPLSFEEFLMARGRDDLIRSIDAMWPSSPADRATHDLLMDECAAYMILGGMPEVVDAFVKGVSANDCQDLLQVIVATYREDFYKYASKAKVEHLRKLFESGPKTLGQKFKYANIDRAVRSRELGDSLNLLIDAGLAYKCIHSSAEGVPLSSQEKSEKFKLYFLDIGLCQRILGARLADILLRSSRQNHLARGALVEQFVAQELVSLTPPNQKPSLHYWHREAKSAQAEVDFLFENHGNIYPLEVKASRSGAMKSLHIFLKEKAAYAKRGVKISSLPHSFHQGVYTLPYYAVKAIAELDDSV